MKKKEFKDIFGEQAYSCQEIIHEILDYETASRQNPRGICFFSIMKGMSKASMLVLLFFLSASLVEPVFAKHTEPIFPRTANYYLHWSLTESQARKLSEWDLVILDIENQYKNPSLIKQMKRWNPHIIILGYITPQEIKQDAALSSSQSRRRLSERLSEQWYLSNEQGARLSWWPGTYLLNVTEDAPLVKGKRFNETLVDFVVDDVLSSGLWDGIFFDNAWDSITFFAGSDIDLNKDGRKDIGLNEKWQEGMKYIYNETRRRAGKDIILVGNGTTQIYAKELNGKMIENFILPAWPSSMETYKFNSGNGNINIINANTGNKGGNTDYKAMRFGLASSLLEDGYYSYDYGDKDHGQLWRYDEYAVNLGAPADKAASLQGLKEYKPDIWRRNFANGISVVNSSEKKETVELDGEFEKIHGVQDTKVNDGSIVSAVDLEEADGIVLLKTYSKLDDILFENGSFARFFRFDGSRVRNGFFVFDEAYKGGNQIARIDLDGNGARDLVLVKANKISVWRDDGQLFMTRYPYTASYKGELRVAFGDLDNDGFMEIYTAPGPGYPAPIKVYTRHGRQMKNDWYPFGSAYKGGYSLALGALDSSGLTNFIVGKGKGEAPEVYVYDHSYNLETSWLAFEKQFRGGIYVATGDLDGDGANDIVAGPGQGKEPIIKIFDKAGTLKNSFTAYTALDSPGIKVGTLDVDFDGKDDIVGFSSGIGGF
ncbi:MAG: VCBS repeat-containing protein [Candidatus Magasanikbacteria bacterium]|nr:VCBS repeat-containing protein [Candidatus Magasanikbacteria bacterium]